MSAQTFALEINAEFERSLDEWRTIIRRVSLDALARVVLKTRVDTGRARGNWFVRIGGPGDEVTEDKDKDGRPTIARGGSVIGDYDKETGFPIISLYNNQPYILVLENGGKNIPVGDKMVALTLVELQVQFR